jgi:hypothetical protein|tara:strand:- start:170 stop:691 length:522 start_codon:yes stop_codon:yes gene_type:complete
VVDTPVIKGLLGSPILAFKDTLTPHGEAVSSIKAQAEAIAGPIGPAGPNKKLNDNTISLMNYVVAMYTDTVEDSYVDTATYPEDMLSTVYLLSKDKEFKYGDGKEIIAIADGGKNQWDKPVKYVRFFYLFAPSDKKPKGTVKSSNGEKTYTFSHEKAKEMWETKIKEGFKRVK